ncbi:hypothetical protein NBRC10512_002330 [Rhodotorula toruloides]|uniref:RHTO0S08e05556g1_1 n=2 Tax=Rhodotorula toruloides TaxID=5286 RepID=A0A061B2U2_RHOTO|nr:uncharacterized protein RHTO_01014 [Rhodotorula toruloides NP11]EMS22260.1 hypothetical protein RHTO_01014 [Rhodotorula toruloides NP11]CDR43781.1 RHTO0S08e05556g1_1 [Rhodotorula toruloides]
MASTDTQDPYPTPSPTAKPASAASRYTGPHRYVYSDDWKELYEAIAGEVKEKKLDVGQEKMLELVLDMWDREFKYDDEPEPDVGLEKSQGSNLTLFQDDDDDEPLRLLPTQPESKQEKRKKKKKKSKKAKRQAASEAVKDGAHDFQGSEAVKPSKHQFFGDEE